MSSPRNHPGFVFFVVCSILAAISEAADAAEGRKLALLVGVDKYAAGSGFRSLPYTERDVEDLAKILVASGYRPEDIRVLTMNRGKDDTRFLPSGKNIRREFELLAKGRKPADSLLIALSGHGVRRNLKVSQAGGREGIESVPFFCPLDAEVNDVDSLISLKTFFETLKESQAGAKVMLVDACQNDSTEGRTAAIPFSPAAPPPTVAALFACSEGEVAWDARELGGGHGVFFHYVIEGLKGDADTDHNNQVTLAELSAYAQEKVPDYVSRTKSKRQMPSLLWNGGKIALLELPKNRKPAPIVAEKTAKKAAGSEKSVARSNALPKAYYEGVEYTVARTEIIGNEWTMYLVAKSLTKDSTFLVTGGRAAMMGGKTLEIKTPMQGLPGVRNRTGIALPRGIEIEIPLKMGVLPENVSQFPIIELFPIVPGGIGGTQQGTPIEFRNVKVGEGKTDQELAGEENKAEGEKQPAKPTVLAKTTYQGVEYKVREITFEGDEATLILVATSLKENTSISFMNGRAAMPGGPTLEIKNPMRGMPGVSERKGISLPKGIEIEISLKLGTLPEKLSQFTMIEFLTIVPGGPMGTQQGPAIRFKNVKVVRP